MKNLPIINCINSFDVHNDILNNKNIKRCPWKNTILTINSDIKIAFDDYEQNFYANTLEKIITRSVFDSNAEYLRKLYSFKNKNFVSYKTKVMSIGDIELSECPICQLDSITAFDHYLPQKIFPQFADCIHNLVPCCASCNSKKSEAFLDKNNQRIFINLYTDLLPKGIKFLIAKTIFKNNKPVIKYEFDDSNITNPILKNLLINTFTSLALCKRFEKKVPARVEILKSTLHGGKIGSAKNTLLKEAIGREGLYGINYWEAVLYRECANNLALLSYLIA